GAARGAARQRPGGGGGRSREKWLCISYTFSDSFPQAERRRTEMKRLYRRSWVHMILVGLGLVGIPTVASAASPPLWCEVAGRGISTFARVNLAEIQKFQSTRTDFQHRLIQYDPTATANVTDNNQLPPARQAYEECANGTDNTGAVVSAPADLVLE